MSKPSLLALRKGMIISPEIELNSFTTEVRAISRLASCTYTVGKDAYWLLCQDTPFIMFETNGVMRLPVTFHIFPGCSVQGVTARNECAAGSVENCCQARWMVAGVRNGLVGRKMEKESYERLSFASSARIHFTQSMSGDVLVAVSAGLRRGTSAP